MGLGSGLGKRIRLGELSWPLWAPILGLAYWVWPLDVPPDRTPIVGLWDDLIVAVLLGLFTLRKGAM